MLKPSVCMNNYSSTIHITMAFPLFIRSLLYSNTMSCQPPLLFSASSANHNMLHILPSLHNIHHITLYILTLFFPSTTPTTSFLNCPQSKNYTVCSKPSLPSHSISLHMITHYLILPSILPLFSKSQILLGYSVCVCLCYKWII